MKEVSANDFYEVRAMGLVSDVDKSSLLDLYEPMIGAKAVAVYLSLLSDVSCQKADAVLTHEDILNKTMLSPGEWLQAVRGLEAVGLVKTLWKAGKGVNYFVYEIYSPNDPHEFFDDALFAGTLKKYIGEKAFIQLTEMYKTAEKITGFDDISEGFREYFHPDYDDPVYRSIVNSSDRGHLAGHVVTGFSYNDFFASLAEINGLRREDFSNAETTLIERLASLYTLDARTMAGMVSSHFDGSKRLGSRVSFVDLEKDARESMSFSYLHQENGESSVISASTPLANAAKIMDKLTPAKFLEYLQHGHKPASSDLKIIENLSIEIGLPGPVVNTLVLFVLSQNDNVLSRAYTEKIGASLARKNIRTSVDAINYLNSSRRGPSIPKPASVSVIEKPKDAVSAETAGKSEAIGDQEIDDMLAKLYKKQKDK